MPAQSGSGESPPLGYRGLASHCILTWRTEGGLNCQPPFPFRKALPACPQQLRKALHSHSVIWAFEFQHVDFGETQTFINGDVILLKQLDLRLCENFGCI